MNLAPPIPRLERPRREDAPARGADRATVNRTPVKSRPGALRRERHQADYVILVVVVALTAIGILMVYSSSALKGYLSQDADTFATVGPQIQWAILGFVAMALMMRVDYRYLRLVSVPIYLIAIVLLVLVFVPPLNIVIGGSARWLKLGPLPAIHPAEFAKLALVIYLAHWFAKRGTARPRLLGRHHPVPGHRRADRRARVQGAGPRHDDGHHPDGVHDVLRRRRQPRCTWR